MKRIPQHAVVLEKYKYSFFFLPLEARMVLLVPLCYSSIAVGQVHVSTLIHLDELSTLKQHIA